MPNPLVVTIARQYGSGGREIGEKVGEMLGCKTYGRELIALSAEKGNMDEAALSRVDEVAAGSLLYTLAMGSNSFGISSPLAYHLPINDKLFYLQSDLIGKIAAEGSAVFIGRCADFVLRERKNTLRVFIYANEECRITRIMERHPDLTRAKAADMMNKVDRRRATYYNFYTGQKWGVFSNYALAVNSSVLGVEDTAKMIADFALALSYRQEKE